MTSAFNEPVRLCRDCSTQGVCKTCGADFGDGSFSSTAYSLNTAIEPPQKDTWRRRRAKGATRTGAIPFCMAEVTPKQSREERYRLIFERWARSGDEYRERMLLSPPKRTRYHAVDGVMLFAGHA